MQYLDLTLSTPEENLACDEALLDLCEAGGAKELLRFWEPRRHFVVLGYSRRLAADVRVAQCQRLQIPIMRRVSGGGTVLQGPGCLNVSLIVDLQTRGPCRSARGTNAWILARNQAALTPILSQTITVQGSSDLALGTRKFSGNAQRRRQRFALFHGTFLLRLNLKLMEEILPIPESQPAYRAYRTHEAFLANLHVEPQRIKDALRAAWGAITPLRQPPLERIRSLVATRYATDAWNLKF